jgi:hypothetical protein
VRAAARVAVIAAVVGLLVPGPATATSRCEEATNHVGLRWGEFPTLVGEFGPVYLYYAVEPVDGTATTPLAIYTTDIGSCPTPPVPAQATYSVSTPLGASRAATSPADFEAKSGNTGPLYDHRQEPNKHQFNVTIASDPPIPEPVVEHALAQIVFTDGIPAVPQEVPLYIVDADGLSRASLETAGPYAQQEAFRDVMIPVFRAGDASQQQSVSYTAEGSSDAPATPGTDFTVTSPQPLVFAAGERAKLITLQLQADGVAEPQEQATVTLTNPGVVDPLDPESATIDLIDTPGGVALPTSTLHHPRQGYRYTPDDYRIREIHVFTERGGGGSVVEAELSIRLNRKNGSCAWLQGKRFRNGSCEETRWIPSDGQYETDFFYFRMSQLPPSVGKIRNYTAFARATDSSKTVEVGLVKGRNSNTFEVTKPKR